jgi:hypothetical protein
MSFISSSSPHNVVSPLGQNEMEKVYYSLSIKPL